MYRNVANTYQQANVFTANPAKLVIMCYEGAVSSLKLAKKAYAAKDFETKGRALQKAIDIINELNASLDVSKGGELAANLRALYLYITLKLTEADLKRDLNVFDESISMLEELASAWKTVASPAVFTGDVKPPAVTMPPHGAVRAGSTSQAWSA